MTMKQETKKQPVFLGFASQKGGVGKSSLAEVLASILYYEKGVSLQDGTEVLRGSHCRDAGGG